MLENYQSVASEQNSPIYRAFVLVLLSPIKAVRSTAIEEVKSLLAKEDRFLLAKNLALKLNEVLEEGKVFGGKEKSPPEEKGGEVTGKMILDCVQALCSFRGEFLLLRCNNNYVSWFYLDALGRWARISVACLSVFDPKYYEFTTKFVILRVISCLFYPETKQYKCILHIL